MSKISFNTTTAQADSMDSWAKGDKFSARHLQQPINVLRGLIKQSQKPDQNDGGLIRGLNIYKITEVVDLELYPITWFCKGVLIDDENQTISEELHLKLPKDCYGVAVGDTVTELKAQADGGSHTVIQTGKVPPLVFKAMDNESGGEIICRAMKLDGTTVGEEVVFKTLPE